ncbi:hypothetical protein GCM10020367_45890 [Streptomyces sannanensis]|uniref:Uncharacterized protein n=1 Tax=Streptomyces sannanensis TaxID=285536 RepID=A0ABP6SGI1_9ACTN
MNVEAWLEEVWSRTRAACVLAGGEGEGPLDKRRILGEAFDTAELARLRELTTTGEFTGDICRCRGSVTIGLLDVDAEWIGQASVHGLDGVSWERHRFRNDLTVADPEGLGRFLSRYPGLRRLST